MTQEIHGRTIVVGYDGTPAARAAVEHAIDRALPDGRLILVHTCHVSADFIGASYYNVMLEDAERAGNRLVDALELENERLASVEHEREIHTGHAATAITRAAEAREADEIVIGSRGVGRVHSLLGSVAHDVIHRAHCPVTVIPDRMVTESAAAGPVAAASNAV